MDFICRDVHIDNLCKMLATYGPVCAFHNKKRNTVPTTVVLHIFTVACFKKVEKRFHSVYHIRSFVPYLMRLLSSSLGDCQKVPRALLRWSLTVCLPQAPLCDACIHAEPPNHMKCVRSLATFLVSFNPLQIQTTKGNRGQGTMSC